LNCSASNYVYVNYAYGRTPNHEQSLAHM